MTLDGPAGVGKSTTAKAVARELGYRHLDSGALYRSVTHALQTAGVPRDGWQGLSSGILAGLGLDVRPGEETVEIRLHGEVLGDELRTEQVTRDVPILAQVPAVPGAMDVRQWSITVHRRLRRS